MFLLRTRRPARFGKWVDRMLAPEPFAQEDADDRLDGALDVIEAYAPEEDGNDA